MQFLGTTRVGPAGGAGVLGADDDVYFGLATKLN